ncbi:MAG: biopolymer transporter ExbD [Ramlibacter sp.]|nr:biopolymer transporter ExbD [Ramlibacter sp.]
MAMSPGPGADPDAEVMVDINTTPLVDVLLVLLVMLIITIPIQLHSVSIDMPGAPPPPRQVLPEVVRVDVTPTGQVLWNGEALADQAALERRLQVAAAQADPPEIHLRPDRAARYEAVAAVLAASQRLGLVKVGIVGSEQYAP